MIDSIIYFVTYGLWCLFLFSFLFYWIVRLIDWIIYDITGGGLFVKSCLNYQSLI